MCPLAISTKWRTQSKTFALFASKCQYECLFISDSSHLWHLATFYIDKSRMRPPQKISFKIQDMGWQNWSGKRLEATRSCKWVFKKCIEVLAATDGLVTSCWHISLWTQPITCSPDLLLAATIRYLRPRPFTCDHDPLLATTTLYLRPRPFTCGHDPLLATTIRYLRP